MTNPVPAFARSVSLALFCLLSAAVSIRAQTKPNAAPAGSPPATTAKMPVETTAKKPTSLDEKVELSPFVVTTAKDSGYYAENTLAGSRLNSNLAHLAASITVVTKQQMEDTGSNDINDVFRYEANTEGSATYTPQVLNRNFVKDTIAGYSEGAGDAQTNATSNRLRGLGVPTTSVDYYQTNPRIPFDSYNTQSVEISRGPNSLLFGLGSPAGVVNQTTAQAALNKNSDAVTASYGTYGSYRAALTINRSLIDDKLAVYGAFLYDDKQFARKPSYDLTRRQFAAFTAKPFKNTKIRGSFENYNNNNRRPNFVSPRDFVTPWLQSGRPAYNPVDRTITYMDSGKVVPGKYVMSTGSPFYTAGYNVGDAALTSTVLGTTTNPNPQYVPAILFDNNTRPLWRIDNGREVDYFQRQAGGVIPNFVAPPLVQTTVAPTAPNDTLLNTSPLYAPIRERRWTSSNGLAAPTFTENGKTYTMSTYSSPGVTNRSIYDWESININQANYGTADGKTYNVEFEQQITRDLFLSAGWLRQDFKSADNYTLSQQTGATITIDTNTYLPDGKINPYFGLPFVQDFQPDTSLIDDLTDNYRAILAYKMDFTQKSSKWLKLLGRHQLMGMWQRQDNDRTQQRKRLHFTSGDADATLRYLPNPLDNTSTGPTGWNYQGSGINRQYYLASPGDPLATVTHGSGVWGNAGYGGPTTAQIEVYDWATGTFKKDTLGLETITRNETTFRSQRSVDSWNLGWQAFLFEDRIAATVGWRRDDYRARSTTDGIVYSQDPDPATGKLVQSQAALPNQQKWVNGRYQTDAIFNRWQRWDELSGNTSTKGVVVRPFKGWSLIDRPADGGSFLADALRNISVTYNTSDNFNPPTAAQVDVFGNALPKPTGEGKDYGIRVALFDNKLVAGFNKFENTNDNERTGAAGLILSRLTTNLDTNIFRKWAETVVRIRDGENPSSSAFASQDLTEAQKTKVAQLWGLPSYDYYNNLPAGIGATQKVKAQGYEGQLTYNPTRNWTMKATFSKQESIYTGVATQYDAWLAIRLPLMKAAVATDIADYNTSSGRAVRVSSFWSGYSFQSDVNQDNTNGNTSPSRFYTNIVDSQYSLAKSQEGVAAPNQRKYHGTFLTNYNFSSGRLNGFGVGGAYRWESKSALGYYGRAADPLNPTILNSPDPTRPIFDKGNEYVDLWISYRHKIFKDKVNLKVQLNVANALESGHLQPIAVNYDGSVYGYRIVDPREFRLTTTFEF